MIRWFAKNGIAANFLMLAILVGGLYMAVFRTPLEITPALSWRTVMIEMPYRGGTAKDVERAILIPIEEALEGVQGIKQLNADGMRGMARFYLTAEPGTDLRALMDDVKARVDTITTFPNETERPRVFIPESGNYFAVLNVAVTGEISPHDLRKVARRVQEDLLEMPGISRAEVQGGRRVEIAVEARADRLLAYNLTFQDLADASRSTCPPAPSTARAAPSSCGPADKPILKRSSRRFPSGPPTERRCSSATWRRFTMASRRVTSGWSSTAGRPSSCR
jgi:multidrug efflux pump subunit AcrB